LSEALAAVELGGCVVGVGVGARRHEYAAPELPELEVFPVAPLDLVDPVGRVVARTSRGASPRATMTMPMVAGPVGPRAESSAWPASQEPMAMPVLKAATASAATRVGAVLAKRRASPVATGGTCCSSGTGRDTPGKGPWVPGHRSGPPRT